MFKIVNSLHDITENFPTFLEKRFCRSHLSLICLRKMFPPFVWTYNLLVLKQPQHFKLKQITCGFLASWRWEKSWDDSFVTHSVMTMKNQVKGIRQAEKWSDKQRVDQRECKVGKQNKWVDLRHDLKINERREGKSSIREEDLERNPNGCSPSNVWGLIVQPLVCHTCNELGINSQ